MADAAALPFAQALYEAAQGEGRLEATNRDLAGVRHALDDSPVLARFLRNPAFPADAASRWSRSSCTCSSSTAGSIS
jgi:F0F1-type ATP synthase delta subunit